MTDFAERCRIAQECLPDAEYRRRLTALHDEMLAVLSAGQALTDERAEALIEQSGGHWREDVFCIGGPDLMELLRCAAAQPGHEYRHEIADEFRRAIPTEAGAVLAAMIEEGVTVLESHIKYACVAQPAPVASAAPKLTDEDVKALAAKAGLRWIDPIPDEDGGEGYPGGFDMSSLDEIRALIAGAPPVASGVQAPAAPADRSEFLAWARSTHKLVSVGVRPACCDHGKTESCCSSGCAHDEELEYANKSWRDAAGVEGSKP